MKTALKMTVMVLLAGGCTAPPVNTTGPYQTCGIKIGEVTDTQAIVWTRLTRNAERVGAEAAMPEVAYRNPETGKLTKSGKGRAGMTPVVNFPDDSTVETIEGAVPGRTGMVRLSYRPLNSEQWKRTDWYPVGGQRDYTHQFKLTDLTPGTQYRLIVESRDENNRKGQCLEGTFRTAPDPDKPERVTFTVSTGQTYGAMDMPGQGYKIYGQMLKLDPDFFVHTGDILYYDKLGKTLPLARWHWQRTYSLPTNVEFHRRLASYFIKDDHDTWRNDCWPTMDNRYMGEFTFKQGQAVFLQQVPMDGKTYRTFRWGRDLQIWLVEGRDYRSPNPMPDGPEKTIWGKEQKDWFKKTVRESDATFKILISPTPLVGPDRTNKNDNHANKGFTHEGNELRGFISRQKNMYVVCGDRHWQYVSQDVRTGVREYSCGPASDKHAGGWSNDMLRPEHKYLNVTGGFLAGIVERTDGMPQLVLRHYSVDGKILNEDRLPAE